MIQKINVFDEFVRQGVFYGLIYGLDNIPAAYDKRFCFLSDNMEIWTPPAPLIVMKLIMLGYEISNSPRSDGSFNTHLQMLKSKCYVTALRDHTVINWDEQLETIFPTFTLKAWLAQKLVKINMTKFEAADFHKYILLTNSNKC